MAATADHDEFFSQYPNNLPDISVFKYNPRNIVHWAARFEYFESLGTNKKENYPTRKSIYKKYQTEKSPKIYLNMMRLDRASYIQNGYTTFFLSIKEIDNEGRHNQIIQCHIKFIKLEDVVTIYGLDHRKKTESEIYYGQLLKAFYGHIGESKVEFRNPDLEERFKLKQTSLIKDISSREVERITYYKNTNNENLPNITKMIYFYLNRLVIKLKLSYNNCESDFILKLHNPTDVNEKALLDRFFVEASNEGGGKILYQTEDSFLIYIYDVKQEKICSIGLFTIFDFQNIYKNGIYDPNISDNSDEKTITSFLKWIYFSVSYTLNPYTTAKLVNAGNVIKDKEKTFSMAALIKFVIFKYALMINNNFFSIVGLGSVAANDGTRKVLMSVTGIPIPLEEDREVDKNNMNIFVKKDNLGIILNYGNGERINTDPFHIVHYYNVLFKGKPIHKLNKIIEENENEKTLSLFNYANIKGNFYSKDVTNNKDSQMDYESAFIFPNLKEFYKGTRGKLNFIFYNLYNKKIFDTIKGKISFYEEIISNNCGLHYQRTQVQDRIKYNGRDSHCLECQHEDPKFIETEEGARFCDKFCQHSFYHF